MKTYTLEELNAQSKTRMDYEYEHRRMVKSLGEKRKADEDEPPTWGTNGMDRKKTPIRDRETGEIIPGTWVVQPNYDPAENT